MVGFHRWSVSILPLSRRTREDRETVVVSIGGGFEPFLRTVVVSIDGGLEDRWRIGGGSVMVSIGGGSIGDDLCGGSAVVSMGFAPFLRTENTRRQNDKV